MFYFQDDGGDGTKAGAKENDGIGKKDERSGAGCIFK